MKKLLSQKNTWILVSIVSFIAFILAAARIEKGQLKWTDWTGFGEDVEISRTVEIDPNQNNKIIKRTITRKFQSGKTLWDWIGVAGSIAVPVLLVYLADRFQASQQEQAEESAKEDVLQAYFDRLSELLIDKNLIAIAIKDNKLLIIQEKNLATDPNPLKDKVTDEEKELIAAAKDVIRARTLSVLQRLEKDPERKSRIIHFLSDTEIVSKLQLDLSHVTLSHAYLSGVNLSHAYLRKADLSHAYLRSADLSHAYLRKANLSHANFSHANLSVANLGVANLNHAYLRDANLSSANLNAANLSHADLFSANLSEANLSSADLSFAVPLNANLSSADLNHADLSFTNLFSVNLSHADLSSADLSHAYLHEANLSSANLTVADLSSTDLSFVNLTGANLMDAIFKKTILLQANLSSTKGLQQNQLSSSEPPLLCATKFPTGMENLSDRDCDQLPQALLDRYPTQFKTLDKAKKYVDDARNQQQ